MVWFRVFCWGMRDLLMNEDRGKKMKNWVWGVEWIRVGKRARLKARLNKGEPWAVIAVIATV